MRILNTLLLLMIAHVCTCADPLIGQWDYLDEPSVTLSNNTGIFVLESMPDKTHFDFDGSIIRFYRGGHVVYEMSYVVTSVAGDIVTIDLSTPGYGPGKQSHQLFLSNGLLQVSYAPGKEYRYKKRG